MGAAAALRHPSPAGTPRLRRREGWAGGRVRCAVGQDVDVGVRLPRGWRILAGGLPWAAAASASMAAALLALGRMARGQHSSDLTAAGGSIARLVTPGKYD